MCGIVGYLGGGHALEISEHVRLLKSMTDRIVPRGPDGEGQWADPYAQVGLGHRRLAIVDLSEAGQQPMHSPSKRYVCAFNGEIYNHLKLRKKLENQNQSPQWNGHSDTETLLAAFDAWGIQETLQAAVGMFAIAVWDRQERTLSLARDRLGEKPLYYGWQKRNGLATFLFGSDLAALQPHPSFQGGINRDALAMYLRHNCIGAEHSIYEGIQKLNPGHLLNVSVDAPTPELSTWWSVSEVAQHGVAHPFAGSPEAAVDTLEVLLSDAIGQQMVADVPLGAFLSGGIDSSTIVALMQAQSMRPVKTFSIGFYEPGYNEAEHAKAVAKHLKTEHTELYVTPEQALAVIPKLPTLYSEPFADSSQIPTFLVSQLARQHVTVSLSGDAGDELFGGYNRHKIAAGVWGRLSRIPRPLRQWAAYLITAVSPLTWDRLGAKFSVARAGDKLHKGAAVLDAVSVAHLYQGLTSHWTDPASVVLGARELRSLANRHDLHLQGLSDVERMMAMDMLSYLPDDILAKVDRAAMGVGLETRVPFLDHRVVEFAWTLPMDYKIRQGVTKWPLRQVLYRHVPRELIERPKMGFGVPIDRWLRGPLRDWAESLLSEPRLRTDGYFRPEPIRRKWAEHLSGQVNWQYHLWDILMFQAWLDEQRNKGFHPL